MDELVKLLTKVELTADDIIDLKQQIVHADAQRHKTREALSHLRASRNKYSKTTTSRSWVCLGDMFIRLNSNELHNLITEDHFKTEQNIDKLHNQLKQKVTELGHLEGKPEISGLSLKPLNHKEISAFRAAFKI